MNEALHPDRVPNAPPMAHPPAPPHAGITTPAHPATKPHDEGAAAAQAAANKLSPEEQMAAFENELKEKDWGHQPC